MLDSLWTMEMEYGNWNLLSYAPREVCTYSRCYHGCDGLLDTFSNYSYSGISCANSESLRINPHQRQVQV
jgi:hypothetical protein